MSPLECSQACLFILQTSELGAFHHPEVEKGGCYSSDKAAVHCPSWAVSSNGIHKLCATFFFTLSPLGFISFIQGVFVESSLRLLSSRKERAHLSTSFDRSKRKSTKE